MHSNGIIIRLIRDRLYADLEILYNFGFSRGGPRCPPRPRIWRPRPIRKHPKFSKAPLRGAETLFPRRRAKKNLARTRKNGFEPGFERSNPGLNPVLAHFGCIFLPFPPVHRQVQLRPEPL